MAGNRHTPDEIISKLLTADRLLANGESISGICVELGVSEATYHRWRTKFGGLKADDARRLQVLELENASLRRKLADRELQILALNKVVQGNF